MRKINYWAILVTVIVTFITSAVWYAALSTQYFELLGVNPSDAGLSVEQILVILGRHLVVTSVIAYLLVSLGVNTLKRGLWIGFLLWLAFPAVLLVGSVSSDNVPIMLAAIHAGDWLIKLLIIVTILVLWGKKKQTANLKGKK